MSHPSPYGLHRVIEPSGALPQTARKVDNSTDIYSNEILVDVEILNITSASFARLKTEHGHDEAALAAAVMEIVGERGKYQDPVLGSGGMLVGTVEMIGTDLEGAIDLQTGTRIATMVSLTATPLKIDRVRRINMATDQVWVEGKAVLFEKGIFARLPDDLPDPISLAVMDVAGAPAMVARMVNAGDVVLVMGGGKAGLLCLHEARKRTGVTGRTIVVEYSADRCREIEELGLADDVVQADATRPVEVMEIIQRLTHGRMADFTINVVNIENSEMACVLSTNDRGTIFFYNTATSFTRAALGAESVGKPVNMLIGNGFVPGHDQITFQILRENGGLRRLFEKIYLKS